MTETPTMAAQVTHLAAVRDVLHAILGAQPDDIQPHHTLHEDLVCDDLDALSIVLALQERFNIEITEDEAEALRRVSDILALLARKVS